MSSDDDFDSRQYAMLMYCSYKGDTIFWNEWRQSHPDEDIKLRKINLCYYDDFRIRGYAREFRKLVWPYTIGAPGIVGLRHAWRSGDTVRDFIFRCRPCPEAQ